MGGMVGTMSTVGWVKEPASKVDLLIAYWFANRKDQSRFITDVQSYNYVVATHQGDHTIDNFLEAIQNSLRSMLLECFDGADVYARAPNFNPLNKQFQLAVSGTVEENGKTYDLAHSVIVSGKTFELITEGRKNV
jgi:hypothetical protein